MLCDYELITPRLAPTWVGFVTVAPPRSDVPHSSALAQQNPTNFARSTIMYSLQKRGSRLRVQPHNLRQPRRATVLPQ